MYKDEETGAYKILAISEGEATIEISSPTNEDVKETIKVNVKPLNIPTIQKVTIDQDEGQQDYKQGEKISIKIAFSEEGKGNVPELQLEFANNSSVKNPEFIRFEDNNTAIRYEYEVQEGDNGILKRAAEAKEQTNQKNDEEAEKLAGYESTIDQYLKYIHIMVVMGNYYIFQ